MRVSARRLALVCQVRARAQIPQGASAEPVWHGLSRPELAREYSPRGQVADMSALFARWTADGAVFRHGRRDLDIAYGPSAFETLDVYRPNRDGLVPLWIFIHGGYWQASDKDQHAQYAAGMLDAGFAVANVNYGLCPDVLLARIGRTGRRRRCRLGAHDLLRRRL